MTSLKKLAMRGAIWTIAGYGSSQLLRFGGNLILTRLLIPEYFGLMAFVNTLRAGIELFSDLGIGQSIVNSKRGDEPVFLNTAWTIQAIRGVVIWLFCLLVTFPITKFYGDDRLMWLIPVMAFSSVVDGFASTSIYTLQRRIVLGKLTRFDLIVQLLSLATFIIGTWWTRSVWALALGVVAGALYRTIASHWLIPEYSNRFTWERSAIIDIVSFGRWMFMASALTFLNDQADRLILAKLLSFQMLGVYTIAFTLACVPKEIIRHLSHRVIFPTISHQTHLPRSDLRAKILKQRQTLLLGFAVFLAFLVTVGDIVIATLYDKRYSEATWMMPILCFGVWFSVLFYTISPALIAIGKPLYSAQSNLAGFTMIAIGLPLAFFHFGIVGAIIVIALSDMPLYIVNLYGLGREQLSCITQDIQSTAFFIAVLALLLIVRNSLGFGLPIQAIL